MADKTHLFQLNQGVISWNEWREKNPEINPNLTNADLSKRNLIWINFRRTELKNIDFTGTDLNESDFSNCNLTDVDFSKADLSKANFSSATLTRVNFTKAELNEANFTEAQLIKTNFSKADLNKTQLTEAHLTEINFTEARLVETNFSRAVIESCSIYGIAAWNINLDGAKQSNLIITRWHEPTITVDSMKTAQFIYLFLDNKEVRDIINATTSRVVLILGRFSKKRKKVLDAIRVELREQYNYLPVLFDFNRTIHQDYSETIFTLASMARFIIADITDPSSIPKELELIVPKLAIPVQPLLEGLNTEYSMFKDYWKYSWVLPVHKYQNIDDLINSLLEKVITPAENERNSLLDKRQRNYQ